MSLCFIYKRDWKNLRGPTQNFNQKLQKKKNLEKASSGMYGGDASQNIRGLRVLEV